MWQCGMSLDLMKALSERCKRSETNVISPVLKKISIGVSLQPAPFPFICGRLHSDSVRVLKENKF